MEELLQITPAVDCQHPQPGEFVRTSHKTCWFKGRLDHRDIQIDSTGTHPQFGPYVRTICRTEKGVVISTTYADANGAWPQFLPAAPTGPYATVVQQEHWRAGYHDVLEYVDSEARYIQVPAEYMEGRAAGLPVRELLDLKPFRAGSSFNPSRFEDLPRLVAA